MIKRVRPFDAVTGTVWTYTDEGRDDVFVLLDGHFDLVVRRKVRKPPPSRRRNTYEFRTLPFRKYLNLQTGEQSGLSEDSSFNTRAKQLI